MRFRSEGAFVCRLAFAGRCARMPNQQSYIDRIIRAVFMFLVQREQPVAETSAVCQLFFVWPIVEVGSIIPPGEQSRDDPQRP